MSFFNLDTLDKKPRKVAKPKMDGGCDTCPLRCSEADSTFIGNGRMGVMILSDSPTMGEDNQYNAFASAQYDGLFNLQGKGCIPSDLVDACYFGYVVPTQVGKENDSSVYKCCSKRLNKLIRMYKPKVIVCLGVWATQALIGARLSGRMLGMKPSDFFGKCIPDREYDAWICPTYHPKMFTWNEYKDDRCIPMYFRRHLEAAFSHADEPMPSIPDDWSITLDADEAAAEIDRVVDVADKGLDGVADVAIDYETTGLKPHRNGHKIVVASVAWRENGAYKAIGFKWDGDNKKLVDSWHRLTHSGKVKLIAHKCDYEASWTRFRGGIGNGRVDWIPSENWSWDTCVAAHVIDNTQKVGLKFHTYCELGVLGYDADADEYLQSKDNDPIYGKDEKGRYSCNAFNGLKDNVWVPWEKICEYCAKDSLYTIYLRDLQDPILEGKQREAYRFLLNATICLASVQSEGFPINLDKLEEVRKEIDAKVMECEAAICETDEYKAWGKVHPSEPFNIDSNKQLGELLWQILKLTPPNGKPDCTADTLEKLNTPMCNLLLEKRKYLKIGTTFLDNYKREAVWDDDIGMHVIRPFFNLATGAGDANGAGPSTYRSSCDSPNLQQLPKRDKLMKKYLRTLFQAPKGYRFMEVDYKALETYVSVSYNHDPLLLAYLQDPSLDMHVRAASLVFKCEPSEVTKDMRQQGKKWNFSSFYGSGARNSAQQIWLGSSKEIKDFLRGKGIRNYDAFERHCKDVFKVYWEEDFKVYNVWKNEQWKFYQRHGYLESYYGFRCQGPMTATNTMNCLIQGSGAHCLLEGMMDNVREFKELGLKSRIIGEIHDSQVLLVKDDEVDKVASLVYKNNVEKLNNKHKWLMLPLVEEADLGADGGDWAHMTEIGACTADGIENKNWRIDNGL